MGLLSATVTMDFVGMASSPEAADGRYDAAGYIVTLEEV